MKRALFAMWILAAGCGVDGTGDTASPDAGDETTASNFNETIQGGSVDKKDRAVGLVWFSGGGFCTGTLVAPNVILTAGHCVTDTVEAFYTGTGKGTTQVGQTPAAGFVAHKVVDQIAHPSYQDANQCPNPTFDVGLLRLADPITDVTPMKRGTKPPRVGARCRTVGYGVHDSATGKVTVEQRRSATEKVVSLDDTSILVEKKSGVVDHGDSGGPLLCGSKIVGTTSCGNDSSPQHTEAYHARVDTIGDWIDGTIAAWQQ